MSERVLKFKVESHNVDFIFDLSTNPLLKNIRQFTGLVDRHGKDLYEGDVVQYNQNSSYDKVNFTIQWSPENNGWVLTNGAGDYLTNELTPEGHRYKFLELIPSENSKMCLGPIQS
jgi:hypothetical protein